MRRRRGVGDYPAPVRVLARDNEWIKRLIAVGFGVLATLLFVQQANDTEDASTAAEQNGRVAQTAKAGLETSNDQLEDAGIDPLVDEDEIPDPVDVEDAVADPSIDEEDVPAEVTIPQAQANIAYAACYASGQCEGKMTAAQASQALTTYCNPRGECRGARGKRGPKGPPPSFETTLRAVQSTCAGSCEGEDGETPTPEEVTTIVGATFTGYCAEHNDCIGPKGEDSTVPGPAGVDGRGAYQVAVDQGFTGSIDEWLASLRGKSAYEIAVDAGFTGSRDDWLASLHGRDGVDGQDGTDGKDAPQPADLTCQSSGDPLTITLTYSDGTTLQANCGTEPPIEGGALS